MSPYFPRLIVRTRNPVMDVHRVPIFANSHSFTVLLMIRLVIQNTMRIFYFKRKNSYNDINLGFAIRVRIRVVKFFYVSV